MRLSNLPSGALLVGDRLGLVDLAVVDVDGALDGLPAEGGLVGARLGHQVLGQLVLGLRLEVLLELGQRLGRYGGTCRTRSCTFQYYHAIPWAIYNLPHNGHQQSNR